MGFANRESSDQQQEFSLLQPELLTFVFHEIRNLLNILSVASELLEQNIKEANIEQQKACYERIRNAVFQIDILINDVLALREIEATPELCNPCLIDLVSFCYSLLEEAQVQSRDRHQLFLHLEDQEQGITVHSIDSFPVDTIEANLDSKLIRPVIRNLLSNSIKYSSQPGIIHLRCIRTVEKIIFQVQDQGIGIPDPDQSKLFNLFYRASNVQAIPGNGLGLSIVKQSVDRHGGQIQVESRVNQGTTVTVSIPLNVDRRDPLDI